MRANYPASTKAALKSSAALLPQVGQAVTTVTDDTKPTGKSAKPAPTVTITNVPDASPRAIECARLGFKRIIEGDNIVLSGKQLLSFAIADYVVNGLKLSHAEVMRIARDYPDKGTSDEAKGNTCALSTFRADMVRTFVLEGAPRPSQKNPTGADPVAIAKAQSAWRNFVMRQRSCGDAAEIALCVLAVDGKLAQFDHDQGAWSLTNQQYVTEGVTAVEPKKRAPMIRAPQTEWVKGIVTVDGKDIETIQARDANNFRRMVAQRYGFFSEDLARHYRAKVAGENKDTRSPHRNGQGNSAAPATITPPAAGQTMSQAIAQTIGASVQGAAGMVTPAGAGSTPVQTANNGLVVTTGDLANPDRNTVSPIDQAKRLDWRNNMQIASAAMMAVAHVDKAHPIVKANAREVARLITKETLGTQDAWNSWLDLVNLALKWHAGQTGDAPVVVSSARAKAPTIDATVIDGVILSTPTKAEPMDKPDDKSAAVEMKRAPRKVAKPTKNTRKAA